MYFETTPSHYVHRLLLLFCRTWLKFIDLLVSYFTWRPFNLAGKHCAKINFLVARGVTFSWFWWYQGNARRCL